MLDCLLNLPQVVRDAAYDNTRAVANSARQLADFEARSAELVQRSAGQLDVPFGTAERLRYDFFEGESGAGTLLFIHGGYWQMRHKNTFRFVAQGPDGHPKLLHCWPVKLLQAGRGDYAGSEVMIRRAAASLSL
ncbi:hypothetical protein [Comamonas testosteroni]|uniref:hypothetical protein n=1 Tax=Comamonas testosteroni TaxID=285 RepID=UPI000A77330D|nr:hypothetical protein [Comamonas testosteroni]